MSSSSAAAAAVALPNDVSRLQAMMRATIKEREDSREEVKLLQGKYKFHKRKSEAHQEELNKVTAELAAEQTARQTVEQQAQQLQQQNTQLQQQVQRLQQPGASAASSGTQANSEG